MRMSLNSDDWRKKFQIWRILPPPSLFAWFQNTLQGDRIQAQLTKQCEKQSGVSHIFPNKYEQDYQADDSWKCQNVIFCFSLHYQITKPRDRKTRAVNLHGSAKQDFFSGNKLHQVFIEIIHTFIKDIQYVPLVTMKVKTHGSHHTTIHTRYPVPLPISMKIQFLWQILTSKIMKCGF